MTDTAQIDELDEDELPQKRRRVWLWACLAAILIIAMLFWARSFRQEKTLRQSGETESAAYAMILGEMRTGIRLALLSDFMAEYPQSLYIPSVRAQRRALQSHEQVAWALLTDELYRVDLLPEDKALAVSNYVRDWTQLSRAAQLAALNVDAPSADPQALTFAPPASPYSKGGTDYALAGARTGKVRRVSNVPPPAVRPEVLQVTQARVRTARRPVYPRRARRKGVTAVVTLSLEIDARGRVVSSTVVGVSAPRYEKDFIKAAQKAAKRSRFYPKTIGGRSVPSHGFLRKYTFSLED